jgi:hypothetical protein
MLLKNSKFSEQQNQFAEPKNCSRFKTQLICRTAKNRLFLSVSQSVKAAPPGRVALHKAYNAGAKESFIHCINLFRLRCFIELHL